MNLKESFRHLSNMDELLNEGTSYISNRTRALSVVRKHLCNKANKEADSYDEPVVQEGAQFKPDDVIRFMQLVVVEREKLAKAIGVAKKGTKIDIDAATEANKARRALAKSLRDMLKFSGSMRKEKGTGYKFNAEGNQMPYSYDVEVVTTEAFDRDAAKKALRELLQKADEVSQEIDTLKVTTEVEEYPVPVFDVNDSFVEAMEAFLAKHPAEDKAESAS